MAGTSPNVLILMADQHASNASGPNGHPLVTTPNLDRLASGGVTFENAYTPYPLCVPARMAFMTAKNIQTLGIWDNGVPLGEDEPTWAHRMRRARYETALAGKMHFRGHDRLHGFQRQLSIDMNSLNYPKPPDWDADLKVKEQPRRSIDCGGRWNSTLESDVYSTEKAIEFLREPARTESPWALTVGFVLPHPPLKAPAEYLDLYLLDDIELPGSDAGEWERLHAPTAMIKRDDVKLNYYHGEPGAGGPLRESASWLPSQVTSVRYFSRGLYNCTSRCIA